MNASYANTTRVYTNNSLNPWFDSDGNLHLSDEAKNWIYDTMNSYKSGYTTSYNLWSSGMAEELSINGKAFATFGPAWFYNYNMPDSLTGTGTYGDWAIVKGPQSYYWGGTWMLAAEGGDNDIQVAKTINTLLNDKEVCKKIVTEKTQFSNNKLANKEVSDQYDATNTGNAFLGGQNDTKIFLEVVDDIEGNNLTIYDRYCIEYLQSAFYQAVICNREYYTEKVMGYFYNYMKDKFPELKVKF